VSRRQLTPMRQLVYVLTAPILVALVRLMWWTYRFEIHGGDGVNEHVASGQPMVLAFWHESLFMMPWYLSGLARRGVGVTYLVSPSMDGEYAVRLLGVVGGRAVRGSATRSGTKAIRGLYRVIVKESGSPVVAVDGPRGPRRSCKKGPVVLAQLSGAPVVPLAAAAQRASRLRTWDRLAIPLPFSRVTIEVGAPVEIPKTLDDDQVEGYRLDLEERIEALAARAKIRCQRRIITRTAAE